MPAQRINRDELRSVLSKTTWKVHDLFDCAAPPRCPPNDEKLRDIASSADIGEPSTEMKNSFFNQLKFIETLRDVDTTNVEPVSELGNE